MNITWMQIPTKTEISINDNPLLVHIPIWERNSSKRILAEWERRITSYIDLKVFRTKTRRRRFANFISIDRMNYGPLARFSLAGVTVANDLQSYNFRGKGKYLAKVLKR